MKGMISTLLFILALSIMAVSTPACQHAPPTLSAPAQLAWQGTRAIKAIDVLRDFAVDAEAQTPKVISSDTTRKIVAFHLSAIDVIHAAPGGWRPTVKTSLDELLRDLPADEGRRLTPYVSLVKTLIDEVR